MYFLVCDTQDFYIASSGDESFFGRREREKRGRERWQRYIFAGAHRLVARQRVLHGYSPNLRPGVASGQGRSEGGLVFMKLTRLGDFFLLHLRVWVFVLLFFLCFSLFFFCVLCSDISVFMAVLSFFLFFFSNF